MSRRSALKLGLLGSAAAALPVRQPAWGQNVPAPPARVFSGSAGVLGGFTVPTGQVWIFDPNITTTVVVSANVIVAGTLVMRPARPDVVHTLRFVGVDESRFVGGPTTQPLSSDVGLWVVGAGILDAEGSPKAGWNRTGDDVTWAASDELIVAPNAMGDLTGFRPFTKGAPVPAVTGSNFVLYRTEVANLTRNVLIEGTPLGRAHIIFLGCLNPQRLRYVAIRYMGPQQVTGGTYIRDRIRLPIYHGVSGRYGLHFDMCGDATRGSLVEGVVVRNTGSQAFVPHSSNGMTFRDCVAHDVRDSGFWWDEGAETNDTVFDRCAVLGLPNNPGDQGVGLTGFFHNLGVNNLAQGCVVVGLLNNKVNSGGYHWPSSANSGRNTWTWDDNVAHNNRDSGIGVWQNDSNEHVLSRYVGYHNGIGISHGAYSNFYTYRDSITFRNGTELFQHALGGITFEGMTFGGNVVIGKHSLPSGFPTRYVNCRVTGMIQVAESEEAGIIRFESSTSVCDLHLDRFDRDNVLSDISVQNSDGTSFQVR